ncbi:MAG: hypothetical protein Q9174_003860 [Haloplaca sp. 1 TL-2023]
MAYPKESMKSQSKTGQHGSRGFHHSTRAATLPTIHHDVPLSQESHLEGHSTTFGPTAPRDFSFRQRVLSRVMGGLMGRPSGTQTTTTKENTERTSTEMPATIHALPLSRQDSVPRPSISTNDSVPSRHVNLEDALSEFPEPPVSRFISPKSPQHSERAVITYSKRTIFAPSEAAVVRPKITIIPEADILSPMTNQNLFVALEITAAAEQSAIVQYERVCGLDIAVIIDNSLFASPATLMANCETARFIATLLDPVNDRMAIICTDSISVEHPELRIMMPLSLADPRRTKSTVDTIVGSTGEPDASGLDKAARTARAMLEYSTPREQNSELGPFAFGHIFVLSPNARRIYPELLTHDLIQTHIVSTGSVPWKGQAEVRSNGWKLQSMHGQEMHAVRFSNTNETSNLVSELQATINDARKGSLHGAAKDMVLDIKPGEDCAIEGVIGGPVIPSIQPGEKVIRLVRLKVGLPPAGGYSLTHLGGRPNPRPECDDPEEVLDMLLGTTPVPILTATLKYKHSLLPSDTECALTTTCRVKRQLEHPERSRMPVTKRNNRSPHEIQKRFVFYLATHNSPRQATLTIIEDFGADGARSACPEYVRMVLKELKYQARLLERYSLSEEEYGSTAAQATPQERRPDAWGQEHFGHGLFDATDYKPQDWITGIPDELSVPKPLASTPRVKVFDRPARRNEKPKKTRGTLITRIRNKKHAERMVSNENEAPISSDIDDAISQLNALQVEGTRKATV